MPNELNELAFLGWSWRAWVRPWSAWRETQAVQRVPKAEEVGAGAQSRLTLLILRSADEVDFAPISILRSGFPSKLGINAC
ncbi:hypothetical protein FVQ98_01770 [Ottowia sp. GY511]|uniref:Uncharacterized protein n=1 Tax=Ottowia flava TaxID=2675430 RepID=A0ABW4KU49_9BURK|nr:hypothetical protein [Ottowia sp. GY511]TXK33626.1 hypothetical protein FVQ98_01770 [Ottowia sp. GY511]